MKDNIKILYRLFLYCSPPLLIGSYFYGYFLPIKVSEWIFVSSLYMWLIGVILFAFYRYVQSATVLEKITYILFTLFGVINIYDLLNFYKSLPYLLDALSDILFVTFPVFLVINLVTYYIRKDWSGMKALVNYVLLLVATLMFYAGLTTLLGQ